ncbi:DUF397 domain-containing protein [Salinactinospora qingdaonensis]|uniref:DUF397 domain-containing protein n=1 Tax=Salinactinospora qingdaonensis TaxID=702744 RepID=A0ABP7FPD4_9ACTN
MSQTTPAPGATTQHDRWRKSSYSPSGGPNCVEVADAADHHAIRDSTRPHAGHLDFPTPAWATFIASIKNTERDM